MTVTSQRPAEVAAWATESEHLEAGSQATTSAARMRWRGLLRWTLPLVALTFLGQTVSSGWSDITPALRSFTGRGLSLMILALVVEVAWVLSLGQVYRSSLVAFGGEASFGQAIRVSMGAFTLSRVLPGGGAVGALLAGREFIRMGNRGPMTLMALVTAGWLSLAALTTIVAIGIAIGATMGSLPWSLIMLPLAVFALLGSAAVVVVLAIKGIRRRMRWLAIVERLFSRWAPDMDKAHLEVALTGASSVRVSALAKVGLWSALAWMLDAAALWTVFAAFGRQLDIGVLSVGYGVANLIQALPEVTPGWLGVLEGSLALTFASLGVPVGIGAIAILSYRLVSFWIPVAAGVPFAVTIFRGRGSHRGDREGK